MTKISHPTRRLSRIEREDIADRMWSTRGIEPSLYYLSDAHGNDDFDLVVSAHTAKEARHAWERWMLKGKVEGKVTLSVVQMPSPKAIAAKVKLKHNSKVFEPAALGAFRVVVDLDALRFEDQYDAAPAPAL
ncbi:hypothetical protein [Methylobacterium sp. WCS2018Hpa-22]|uniref:hypothetical protein n=1 Tax=Methylobacterium sp. WCS2018Hpa-22 TaxID=3073633 RepID=UPI00288B1A61|nr:hypothetical protein [Methylobacterium sp. WCS2018Hpa-22]